MRWSRRHDGEPGLFASPMCLCWLVSLQLLSQNVIAQRLNCPAGRLLRFSLFAGSPPLRISCSPGTVSRRTLGFPSPGDFSRAVPRRRRDRAQTGLFFPERTSCGGCSSASPSGHAHCPVPAPLVLWAGVAAAPCHSLAVRPGACCPGSCWCHSHPVVIFTGGHGNARAARGLAMRRDLAAGCMWLTDRVESVHRSPAYRRLTLGSWPTGSPPAHGHARAWLAQGVA